MRKIFKIPNLFFKNNEKIDFNPEMINWDDSTICVLCRKIDCICVIQKCPCNIDAANCKWSSNSCPCQKCLELNRDCKCIIKSKKEK